MGADTEVLVESGNGSVRAYDAGYEPGNGTRYELWLLERRRGLMLVWSNPYGERPVKVELPPADASTMAESEVRSQLAAQDVSGSDQAALCSWLAAVRTAA